MSTDTAQASDGSIRLAGHFGAGGSQPYEVALAARREAPVLHLHSVAIHPGSARPGATIGPMPMDVGRFLAAADRTDRGVLRHTSGGVLDVGSGPGRMVREAVRLGRRALGIDVSPMAVAIAREAGLPVLQGSVFDAVPAAGTWGTTLLLDGNIGIGGDPTALLARCAELTAPNGVVVVETHPDPDHDVRFGAVLVDHDGEGSAVFPWAQAGARALRSHARVAGLALVRNHVRRGRSFVFLGLG